MRADLMGQAIMFGVGIVWMLFMFRMMWKLYRTHRDFESVMNEVSKADEKMRQAKTVSELNARYERVQELLEHAANIAKR